jgi:hypothetical protein
MSLHTIFIHLTFAQGRAIVPRTCSHMQTHTRIDRLSLNSCMTTGTWFRTTRYAFSAVYNFVPENNAQGVSLQNLEILRVLYGVFGTYKDSPLAPSFDRVLQVGDASGIQVSNGIFWYQFSFLAMSTGAACAHACEDVPCLCARIVSSLLCLSEGLVG